ncbi:hypothetical protein [Allocoleopsis sp.]
MDSTVKIYLAVLSIALARPPDYMDRTAASRERSIETGVDISRWLI